MTRSAALLLAVTVVAGAAACGGGDDDAGSEAPVAAATADGLAGLEVVDDGDPALPVTVVDSTGTEVTIASTDRIVAVNGDLTEVVFALGLGDRGRRPRHLRHLPRRGRRPCRRSGTSGRWRPSRSPRSTPPSSSPTPLAGPPEAIEQLRALGLPVVVLDDDDSVDGPGDKIRAAGAVLGVAGGGRVAGRRRRQRDRRRGGPGRRGHDRAARRRALPPGGGHPAVVRAGQRDVRAARQPRRHRRRRRARHRRRPAGRHRGAAHRGARRPRRHDLGPRVRRRRRRAARPARRRPRPDPRGEHRRILAYEDQYLLGFGPRTGAALADLARDLHPELEDSP